MADGGVPDDATTTDVARHRRRGAVTATIGSVTAAMAIAAGLSAWGAAPPADAGEVTLAAGLLPADGSVTVSELTITGPNDSGTTSLILQEHQRASGFDALSALPQTIGAQVLGLFDDDELATLDLWRVMSRTHRDGQTAPVLTDLYQLDDRGLHRVAGAGGAFPSVYEPPLLAVPADPAVGDRWSASGSALLDGVLSYDYAGEVEAVDPDGCVTVTSTLEVTMSGEPLTTSELSDRWCPGQGVVEASGRFEQLGTVAAVTFRSVDDRAAALAALSRPAPGPTLAVSDPDTWGATPLRLVARDPFFGDMTVEGISALPPVIGDDGLVVIALSNGNDIIGLRPSAAPEDDADTAPRLVEQWRLHPGGAPLAVTLVGDLVVVSTAERTLTAYGLDGVRRWAVRTDDLVLGAVARTHSGVAGGADASGTDAIVAQDLSGRLTAWRAADGSIAWRAATRADSDLAPVMVGTDLLVAADRSGDVLAIDPATGRERWRLALDGVDSLGVAAGMIIVDTSEGTVSALDADGDELWVADTDVWQARIDTLGDQVALVGSDEVVVLDPDAGSVAWRLPVEEWADASPEGLAVHHRDRMCRHDTTGRETHCWPLDSPSTAVRLYVVATPAGLWASDGGVDVVQVGDPPGALP